MKAGGFLFLFQRIAQPPQQLRAAGTAGHGLDQLAQLGGVALGGALGNLLERGLALALDAAALRPASLPQAGAAGQGGAGRPHRQAHPRGQEAAGGPGNAPQQIPQPGEVDSLLGRGGGSVGGRLLALTAAAQVQGLGKIHHGSFRQPPPKGGGFLQGILSRFHLDSIDAGDLILLLIIYLLFREGEDEELLIALGLLLIL